VRYVKGKKNDGHIKTYSTKKISNGYPTMCSGAFLCPETNNPICPGNAPRDPTKIVLVNGQQVELCGCCAGSPTTPLDIRQHFPNRDFNTTNFVPIANHNDPNSYYNVGMNYFQGFIGSKTLCNTLVGKGLRVKRTKQFDPTDQFTIEDMENQLSEAANNEQDYIFSNTLQRNVILSDANYWHGGVAKALTKYVQPFKGYLDRFEPAQNNNTCEVINGWISYYKTQRETGIPRSAHFTYGLFNWHRDAGLTGLIENRLALTWLNDEDGTVSKRMFFVDRSTGDWFSFLCSHGCAVSMSREVSGFSDGRYMHKVVDAEGTYALVLQVSNPFLLISCVTYVLTQHHLSIV